jgi:NAD(P)-dependent dehydrogenase (short-subunit alcohol dehydrogenase family)
MCRRMISGVIVNSVHPGAVDTNLFSRIPQPAKSIMNFVARAFFRVSLCVCEFVLSEVLP